MTVTDNRIMFGFAMSGLQEFLFDVDTDLADRRNNGEFAARRLRLRSAYLSLIPALVAHYVFEGDSTEIFFLGGGKLLMEIAAEREAATTERLWDLYEWLVIASDSRLSAYWAFSEQGNTPSDSLKLLLDKLNAAKWRSGRRDGHWIASSEFRERNPEKLGSRDWESDEGALLVRSGITGFNIIESGGWEIGPWQVKMTTLSNSQIPLTRPGESKPSVSIPLHAKQDESGKVIELWKLAEDAPGADYLALLKLDGDGIGKLIHGAIKKDSELAQYKALSGRLSGFFGYELLEFLKGKYPSLYLVYSGGDDLVATGHFKDVLHAALDIKQRYSELELGTVSAGISFYTRQSPILKAVEAAERELDIAKETKNAICISGCRLSWGDFDLAMREVDALDRAIDKDNLNRGILQLLRQLGEPWQQYEAALREQAVSGAEPESNKFANLRFRSIPLVNYMQSRRSDAWKREKIGDELAKLFDDLCSGEPSSKPAWQRLALVATIAGWMTKQSEFTQEVGANS